MTPNVTAHRPGDRSQRRVLVVEDDEDILDSMSSILESAGYRVDGCVNGRVALDSLQQDSADAVVLDLMMPVMNGWEFVTAKKADPSIAEIPIVAISADDSAKARAIRADSYIPKPFDADELVAAVGRVLLEADRRKLAPRLDETERLRSVSRRAGDERTVLDVEALLESVISMAGGELSSRILLVRQYQQGIKLLGDEKRLTQVFLNLVVNAAQSLPKDWTEHRHIFVGARKEGAVVVVEVRDTGRGMTPAQKERIFEPFFTTKGKLGGTGFGFAISKEIVEGHGGTIAVTSELGLGSSFTVRLPAAPAMGAG